MESSSGLPSRPRSLRLMEARPLRSAVANGKMSQRRGGIDCKAATMNVPEAQKPVRKTVHVSDS